MWLTGLDQYQWSFYLTNIVALVLNVLIVIALFSRIWRTRGVTDGEIIITRIAKGVLIVSSLYQICLSTARLVGWNVPIEFRDTWVLKDIGIFFYVVAVSYLHRQVLSRKVADLASAERAARERSMQQALESGRTNHDERLRNRPSAGDRRP